MVFRVTKRKKIEKIAWLIEKEICLRASGGWRRIKNTSMFCHSSLPEWWFHKIEREYGRKNGPEVLVRSSVLDLFCGTSLEHPIVAIWLSVWIGDVDLTAISI